MRGLHAVLPRTFRPTLAPELQWEIAHRHTNFLHGRAAIVRYVGVVIVVPPFVFRTSPAEVFLKAVTKISRTPALSRTHTRGFAIYTLDYRIARRAQFCLSSATDWFPRINYRFFSVMFMVLTSTKIPKGPYTKKKLHPDLSGTVILFQPIRQSAHQTCPIVLKVVTLIVRGEHEAAAGGSEIASCKHDTD